MTSESAVTKDLKKLSDPKRAKASAWFFKTGPGQYGEGDVFWGIRVPEIRKVAQKYIALSFGEIKKLLASPVHEHRFVALEILVAQYEKATPLQQKRIVSFYLKNIGRINNWDLVDTSAPYILGDYYFKKDKAVLYKLARSKTLWDRRIAIVATAGFISKGAFKDTLKICSILLEDQHDLIHKATGWMLREVGKRSPATLKSFLNKHHKRMPRTMLRYSIERLSQKERRQYLT